MKLLVAFLSVSVCLFGLITALDVPPPTMYRRAVVIEECPQDVSCYDFAKGAHKSLSVCASYEVQLEGQIKWNTCGLIVCLRGTKLRKEDLSKPYPDCCAQCA